jgi:hypothetical protein
MATFIISPLNAISFKEVNSLLPNFNNTLSINEDGVKTAYVQKFLDSDTIRTQMFSDYDTITAFLIDCDNNQIELPVTLVKQSTDEITSEVYSYYEFSISGQSVGQYNVGIKGVKSGELDLYFNSEPFEIEEGLTGFRYAFDGTKKEYEYIPNHFKITASNTDSDYIYWGDDRLSGDAFEVSIWVAGTNDKPQSGGDVEVYDNVGNLSKLEQISQRIYELKTEDIPKHLALKVNELAALDFFAVNDEYYVNEENGENEFFGTYNGAVLTMTLTQKFVIGVNSDDKGFSVINSEDVESVKIKQITNVSGSQQLIIDGGYTLNQVTIVLEQGTNCDVKIGTSPSGNEIMRSENISTSTPIKNIARNYVNQSDQDASLIAYIDISGVGAAATVILQTIINKQ